jgi:DNA-directed RNA polymerase subunit RPC12/RpoP
VRDRPPPLNVLDLTRPAGADVDKHGEVACVTCGKRVSVMEADVVGLGYRCARCSATATADDDVVASLPASERSSLPRWPRRSSFVIAGIALFAVAVLMWIFKWDAEWTTHEYGSTRSLFLIVVIATIGCFGIAAAPRR